MIIMHGTRTLKDDNGKSRWKFGNTLNDSLDKRASTLSFLYRHVEISPLMFVYAW